MSLRVALAILNVVGGVGVLVSYTLAFQHPPEVRDALWGGVPAAIQPVYTASMLAAALGYFPMTHLFVLGTPAYEGASTQAHARALFLAYAALLVPSAMWLPMTIELILAPSLGLWWLVRLVLFAVAAGTLTLLLFTWRHARASKAWHRWLPVAGAAALALQTVVLDALVWPAFYPM
jgi:hypothetical protein